MAFYQFKRQQFIDSTMEQVWNFIASPINLKKITPASMGFDILTDDLPLTIYEGMIIHYRVKPFPFWTTHWISEISYIEPGEYFVDEQRVGPYDMWHHEHRISEHDNGVLMTDIVSYQPPLGGIGRLANALFIRHRLNEIFDFREQALREHLVKIVI